jgi:DNA primase
MLHRKNPNPAVDIKAALELLPRLEPSVAEFEFSDYETLTDADVKAEFFEFPEWWLDSFMAAPDHPYLAKRGITPEVGAALGIRYDSQRSRICFPIRDWNGRLGGLHGRDITGKHELRYYAYDFNGSRNPRIWLGEHHCTLDSPLVLVEGPFDYAKVYGVWPNVLSANMAKVSPYKLERIQDAIQIVTFYDAGVGGDKARQQVQDVLGDSAGVVHLVPDSAERDPGDMTPQEISNYLDSVLGGPFGAASWGIDNPTGV